MRVIRSFTTQVVDQDAQPVKNATVKAFYSKDIAYTDNAGNFSIEVTLASDKLVIEADGFNLSVVEIDPATQYEDPLILERSKIIDGSNQVSLPYAKLSSNRNVSAEYTVTGDELASYPTHSILEALSGRIPGLAITQNTSTISLGMPPKYSKALMWA